MTHRFQQITAQIFVLALLYFVTGWLGLMLPAFGSQITLIWLPTGIAVAALLRWGFGCWPGIALGAVAVNLAVGSSWPVALGIAVENTLGSLLAAWALQRMRFHPAFDQARDVTERGGASADLERSLSKLQLLINTVPAYISFVDAEERYRLVNKCYEEYFGLPADRLIGQRICDVQSAEAYAEMQPHIRAVLAGETVRYQSHPTNPDGASHWFDVQYVPRRGEDGSVAGFFVLVSDITESKKAEEALRESEDRFRKLIEHAPEAVMLVDSNANWVGQVNPAAERLFKMSAAELCRVGPTKMSPPVQPDGRPSSEKGSEFVVRAMAGEAPVFEWVHRDAEGRDIPCEVSLLRMEVGGRTVVRGSITDISERKRAEAALEKSRQRFEQLVSSIEGIVWEADAQTFEFNFVSEQAERLLGYPVEQWLEPDFWAAHIHPDDRAATTEYCVTSTRQGRNHDFEYRMLAADGRVLWLRDIVTLLIEEGVPRLLRGIMVDITERKRAEEALSAAAEFTRSLIGSMQDGFSVLDAKGVQSDVNPAFCTMTGFSREEIIGTRAPYPYWPPEEHERIQAALTATMTGNISSFELTFMRRNGERFPVIVSPSAVKNQAGETISYCATVKDVTELKRADEALRESEARYRLLFEANPHPMWVYEIESLRFLAVNAAAIAHYGYTREEFLNMAIKDIRPPEDVSALLANVASVDEGLDEAGVWRHLKRDGSLIDVEICSHVLEFDGRRAELVLAHDVTERLRATVERDKLDRKVQETQKLESLGVLAGGIAHDFNNLLTAILGNASIAQMELPPGSSVQDCLEHINEASLRAADLCKQMLAYSGRGRFVVQTLDLGELVEQTAQMLQISISKKAVLRYRLEKGLPPVEADATQLRQVIMNLVINASEAIGDTSGVISISTGLTRVDSDYLHGTLMGPDLPVGDYVFLEVSDSGCGMSAETKAKIFDPFFTTKFTGRGLGLAAVLGIVRGHKGAMKVYSEVGRGTNFKVLFPASAGTGETATALPAAIPVWRGQGTVLVVDDEETMRSTVARMMRLIGLDPLLAADGREAVEIFRANPAQFALVLLDLTMPHMDGEQTFTELRRLRSDVRVVLMSGFNAHEALVRFNGKGLASFLQKPFTIGSLRTTLQGAMGGKEPVQPDSQI